MQRYPPRTMNHNNNETWEIHNGSYKVMGTTRITLTTTTTRQRINDETENICTADRKSSWNLSFLDLHSFCFFTFLSPPDTSAKQCSSMLPQFTYTKFSKRKVLLAQPPPPLPKKNIPIQLNFFIITVFIDFTGISFQLPSYLLPV